MHTILQGAVGFILSALLSFLSPSILELLHKIGLLEINSYTERWIGFGIMAILSLLVPFVLFLKFRYSRKSFAYGLLAGAILIGLTYLLFLMVVSWFGHNWLTNL